jgi:hypothetical protein
MKAYEGLKPWCLLFGLNDFTHELIGPQTNNVLFIIWGQTTKQEVFKFLIIGPQDFFALIPTLKDGPKSFLGRPPSNLFFE